MSDETPTTDEATALGAAMRSALEGLGGGIATAVREAVTEAVTPMVDEIRALRPVATPAADPLPERDPSMLPGGQPRAGATDRMRTRFESAGWKRSDFELAGMLVEGASQLQRGAVHITMPADFEAERRHHLFETGQRIMVADSEGNPVRAMDTAESGYGLQLIGAQYESEMWMAARQSDPLLGAIRSIPMTAPVTYVPIDGALPEMLLLGESTTAGASAYTTSKTPTNRATLTAKKFGINQIWSGELDQDSIIAFTPFLRAKLFASAAHFLASSYYNGDTTNAATGNINLDDADPADTKHFLAYNGIHKSWLITTTAQGKDMAGALDPKEIDRARGKLNATTDDVNGAPDNQNWGADVSKLMLLCDWDTYMNLLDLDVVTTVDKYGQAATVLTGELGRYKGMRVFAPAYVSKTEADGKASTTEANNTKGQISVFNTDGFLAGNRAGLALYFDRIQRTDQFLFEMYTRQAFTQFGTQVASGIYDITV